MRNSLLISASLLVAFAGCGRSWLPCLHRGAPCYNGQCSPAAHTVGVNEGCDNCNTNYAGYESYGDSVPGTEVVPYQSLPRAQGGEMVVPNPAPNR